MTSLVEGLSIHYNEVWDIYGNRVILYGHFRREISATAPSKETILESVQDGVPNYTSEKYLTEKAKLFGE